MKLQRLYSYVRRAVDDYNMIEDGDKIAICVSGGKDSLTLLYALGGMRDFYPKKYEIVAVTVDLGYESFDLTPIKKLCDELKVEYHIEKTEISKIIGEVGCSLCARLRRGAIGQSAKELGCNKIAYAHSMDDAVETMMLSLIYEGRFSSFEPVTRYEDNEITLIRPLIYTPASAIVGFSNRYNLPIVKNPCPFDNETERTYVRNLLNDINKHAPGVKDRMLTALKSGVTSYKLEK